MKQIFILIEAVNEQKEIGFGIDDFIAVSTDLAALKAEYTEDYLYSIYGYIPEKHGAVADFLKVRIVCKREPGRWVDVEGEDWID